MFASTILKRARPNLGNLQWMPTMPMVLLNATHATPTSPATAQFRVLPKMTKHEVKEYLTKIYGLPVTEVRTQNYLGKRMRIFGKRQIVYAKRPDYKKAFVTFDGSLADTGRGGAIYGAGEQGGQEGQTQIAG
jgi:large subunit ribosomal protein L23